MKQNFIVIICISVLFGSCAINKPYRTQSSGKTPLNLNGPLILHGSTTRSTTAINYIERYKAIAIAEMNQYGIPASITLAQGLLESGSGNSPLATQANNHFGIKCTSSWSGKTILKDDDQSNECFRVYKSPEDSFRDHSEFLKRTRYMFLFDLAKNDYVGWAKGLKKAGYATNPSYPDLLISLIERYSLHQYDRKDNPIEKNVRENNVIAEIEAKETVYTKTLEPLKLPVVMKIYEVKQGDTLYTLAKRFNLSVDDLKILNNLPDDSIKLGQLLLVSK